MRRYYQELEKRQKLLLIAPSGKEYKVGFLSSSKDGIILGTAHVEGVNTSHLTVLLKEGTLSSHITPQTYSENRRFFPSMDVDQIVEVFKTKIEPELVTVKLGEQILEEVLYVTEQFSNWINSIYNTLYQKRVISSEVIHVLNFKELLEKLPQHIDEFRRSPQSFIGLCKAKDILDDESKIFGVTRSGSVILPFDNQLYSVDLSSLTNFSFDPSLDQREISSPLNEIYRSMGIPQYMKEIVKKKIIEKLLSSEIER